MTEQTEDTKLPPVNEPRISFKVYSDKVGFDIKNAETQETLVSITGYGLEVGFNHQYLKSVQDIEAAVKGIGDMFRDMILESIMQRKKQ